RGRPRENDEQLEPDHRRAARRDRGDQPRGQGARRVRRGNLPQRGVLRDGRKHPGGHPDDGDDVRWPPGGRLAGGADDQRRVDAGRPHARGTGALARTLEGRREGDQGDQRGNRDAQGGRRVRTRCKYCRVQVADENLRRHYANVHPQMPFPESAPQPSRHYTVGAFFSIWKKPFGSPTRMLVNGTAVAPTSGQTLWDQETISLTYSGAF